MVQQVKTQSAIPIMTSNTTPSGIASSSSIKNGNDSYKAFNRNTGVWQPNSVNNEWIAYEFPSQISIAKYIIQIDGVSSSVKSWRFEGWNGVDWVILDIQTGIIWTANYQKKEFIIDNKIEFKKYRIIVTETSNTSSLFIGEIDMFERMPVNKILISLNDGNNFIKVIPPKNGNAISPMNGYTSLDGEVSASSEYNSNSFNAWKAFNGDKSSHAQDWITASKITTAWIKYKFNNPKVINKYSIVSSYNVKESPIEWTFECSNDNLNWIVLDTQTNQINWSNAEQRNFDINNEKPYVYYRLNITNNDGGTYVGLKELELHESTDGEIIHVNGSEKDFLSYGMDKSLELDMSTEIANKVFIEQSPTTLGSGKVFKQSIDTLKTPIKKVTIE